MYAYICPYSFILQNGIIARVFNGIFFLLILTSLGYIS